jgi:ABC-type Fe3+ transport system substrate-binding protein
MLPGNAQVRDAVAAGEFDLGLTDSDDVVGGLRQGLEIRMIVPDQESDLGALMIPNTVGRVAGRPDTESARALVQSLLSADTEKALALSRSAQIPLRHSVEPPSLVPPLSSLKLLSVDYVQVARYLPRMLEILDEEWPR